MDAVIRSRFATPTQDVVSFPRRPALRLLQRTIAAWFAPTRCVFSRILKGLADALWQTPRGVIVCRPGDRRSTSSRLGHRDVFKLSTAVGPKPLSGLRLSKARTSAGRAVPAEVRRGEWKEGVCRLEFPAIARLLVFLGLGLSLLGMYLIGMFG